MEIFWCDEKKKHWYQKANWLKVLFVFMIIFVIFFFFFYFLIGNKNNGQMAISYSLLIALLISFGVLISSFLENRINIYVEKDKKIYALFPHIIGNGYNNTLISYKKFREIIAKEDLENIFYNQQKYYGVDVVELINVIRVKKCLKGFKFKAKVISNEWYSKSLFFVGDDFKLKKKDTMKTFFVPCDYEKYEELYDLINKMKKS